MKELGSAHPNVLKLLGWRDTHFNVQLILELFDLDLRKYINHQALVASVAKKLAKDIFSAVTYVHSCQILQRDIKPPNILVQRQPLAAILGDFGCARKLLRTSSSAEEQVLSPDVCTLWYRAPEILLSHHQYGCPSDIWSVGVVLAEMKIC